MTYPEHWVRGPYFITAYILSTTQELFCHQNGLIPVKTRMLTGLKDLTEADIAAGLITGRFTKYDY